MVLKSCNNIIALFLFGALLAGCATVPPPEPTPLEKARQAERVGDYSAMLMHCRIATREPNPDPWAFLCIADAQAKLGNRQAAKTAYLTYLERNPDDINARLKLIEIYMDEGLYNVAQQQIENLIRFDPANYQAYYYLGEIHRLHNVCQTSVQAYQRSLEIYPEYNAAKAGLEKVQKEVCPPAPKKVVQRKKQPVQKAAVKKPAPKEEVFLGGGKALRESEW